MHPARTALLPALALALLAPSPAAGDKPKTADSKAEVAADDPKIPFERYKLENGLEVILHQDRAVPLVAVNVWYHVGSGDETPGKSGFAHLFEHMLFQGSKHVGEDKHFEVLLNIGASGVNGTTNSDRTNYFEVVPSHQIETALWLESDRMGYMLPLLNEKSLRNQIEVVRNERRQNYDNVPYGKTRFATNLALYPEGHPYRYLTIGRHEDLDSSTLDDVIAFYKQWYAPANATLVVAGDFEIATAKTLIEKWFGGFPKTVQAEHVAPPTPQVKKSRVVVDDEFAKLRRIDYVWHTPGFYRPGDAEFDILSFVLGAEGTGRLYKILVHDKQLAQNVAVYQASAQFSSTFAVMVTAKSDADLATIEKIVAEEMEKVRTQPITAEEFARAVTNLEASFIWRLESLMARANTLQQYNHFLGNPDAITEDLDRYRNTTPEKIQRFASEFLGEDKRVEILTQPAASKSAPKGAK